MKPAYLIIICFTTCIFSASAQSNVTVPFTQIGKLIVINGSVDGREGNFIVDTGIPGLILNSRFFKGNSIDVPFSDLNGKKVEAVGVLKYLHIQNMEILAKGLVIDLSKLEKNIGIPIHGLIGTRVFRKFELFVDLESMELTLIRLKSGQIRHRYTVPPIDTLDFFWKGYMVCLKMKFGGKNLYLGLDTGAEISLITPTLESRLKGNISPMRATVRVVGFGEFESYKRLNILENVQLKDQLTMRIPFLYHSMYELNQQFSGPRLHGLIGYQPFGATRFAINFVKKEIYLWRHNLKNRRIHELESRLAQKNATPFLSFF